MGSARKYAIIVFLLAALIIIYLSIIYIDQNRYVTKDVLDDYSQTYIQKYISLTEKYIQPDNRTYLQFYTDNPYFIRETISTTYGAGLEFIPSNVSSSELRITDKRIEDSIFDGDNNPAMFNGIGAYIAFEGINFVTRGTPFHIRENGSIWIKDIIVDNKVYNYVIIKGSNCKKNWTKLLASEEATGQFTSDLSQMYSKSEEFRKYFAIPELSLVASRMAERGKNGTYAKDPSLYYNDLGELYKIAKNYNISTKRADEILHINEMKEPAPSWWDKYDELFLIRGFIGFVLFPSIVYFLNRIWKKREFLLSRIYELLSNNKNKK